jgi:serine/threonine protein kinase
MEAPFNFNELKRNPNTPIGHYFSEHFYFIETKVMPINIDLQKTYFHENLLKAIDCVEYNDKYYTCYPKIEETINVYDLSYEERIKSIKSLVEIIMSLHENGIIHGDIQLRNIMIAKSLHLIDLENLSIENSIYARFMKVPELILGGKLNKKTDIFMLSLLIYEILNETVIPHFDTPIANICYIKTLKPIKNKLNDEMFESICKGLSIDPLERNINAQEIYNSF